MRSAKAASSYADPSHLDVPTLGCDISNLQEDVMRPFIRLAALATLVACASEKQPDAAAREMPLLRLEARDFTFSGPAEARAGLTRVRLVNHGPAWHEALLTRLPDEVTPEAYLASARAGDAFPVGALDVGGPGKVAAGDSSDVLIPLEPGRYAIVCWSDNHVTAGMIMSFVVTVSAGDRAAGTQGSVARAADSVGIPVASGEVRLEDFRIAHDSSAYRRGANMLRVRNTGARPHDLTFYRLEPGRTAQDFGVWYATRQGAPPAVPVGGMVTLAPGREGWAELDLTPGRYLAACGTPEPGPDGVRIHAQMGMVEVFEIP